MSHKVIDALTEWTEQKWYTVLHHWSLEDTSPKPHEIASTPEPLHEDAICNDEAHLSELSIGYDWHLEPIPTEPPAMALCRVLRYAEKDAECTVFVDGLELPRVAFPAWILRGKNLKVDGRFIWIMRHPSRIRPGDIDPDVQQDDGLTIADKVQLERLYDVFERGLAEDKGEWPEYHGDGK
jgi:hypothetical protein